MQGILSLSFIFIIFMVLVVIINIYSERRKEDRIAKKNAQAFAEVRRSERSEMTGNSPYSLSEKLRELDALKNEGIITEEEYSSKRKKLIDNY